MSGSGREGRSSDTCVIAFLSEQDAGATLTHDGGMYGSFMSAMDGSICAGGEDHGMALEMVINGHENSVDDVSVTVSELALILY